MLNTYLVFYVQQFDSQSQLLLIRELIIFTKTFKQWKSTLLTLAPEARDKKEDLHIGGLLFCALFIQSFSKSYKKSHQLMQKFLSHIN